MESGGQRERNAREELSSSESGKREGGREKIGLFAAVSLSCVRQIAARAAYLQQDVVGCAARRRGQRLGRSVLLRRSRLRRGLAAIRLGLCLCLLCLFCSAVPQRRLALGHGCALRQSPRSERDREEWRKRWGRESGGATAEWSRVLGFVCSPVWPLLSHTLSLIVRAERLFYTIASFARDGGSSSKARHAPLFPVGPGHKSKG